MGKLDPCKRLGAGNNTAKLGWVLGSTVSGVSHSYKRQRLLEKQTHTHGAYMGASLSCELAQLGHLHTCTCPYTQLEGQCPQTALK